MEEKQEPDVALEAGDQSLGDAVLRQAFDLWLNPEIERRRTAGELPADFYFVLGQIIMDPAVPQNIIRLNEEVRGIAQIDPSKGFNVGDVVYLKDIESLAGFELLPEDRNCGHLTVLRRDDRFMICFDFRYNRERIAHTYAIAHEFLRTADSARAAGYFRAAIDNLWSSAEMSVKTLLLDLPDAEIIRSKTHGVISSKINTWAKENPRDQPFVRLLNELTRLRPIAKYRLTPDAEFDRSLIDRLYAETEALYKRVAHGVFHPQIGSDFTAAD